MFHPISMPMERGWVGRVEGDEVVHLASPDAPAPVHGRWVGARPCPVRARRRPASLPLPTPPSVRVFDLDGAFEFANPAAVVGPGSSIKAPKGSAVALDAGLAGLVGLDSVKAVCDPSRDCARRRSHHRRIATSASPRAVASRRWTRRRLPRPSTRRAPAGPPRRSRPDSTGRRLGASRRRSTRFDRRPADVAPVAVVVEVPPGPVAVEVEGCGTLELTLEARPMTHTFRRLDGLPPYVFAVIRELTLELRRAGEDVVDLGFGNPDLRRPRGRRREAAGGGGKAAQPPLLGRRRASPSSAPRAPTCTRRFGVELDPETQVVATMGAKEGLVAPDVGARRAGRRGARACAELSDPHPRADARGRQRLPGSMARRTRISYANLARGVERASPRARGPALSFPHNPTTAHRRARLHGAGRRVRTRARDARGARLRLRRPRLRRLRAAVDPPGARRRRRRGRALHADEVVLDGRLARRLPRRQRARSCGRSRGSRAGSTTARSSRSRSPRSPR